MGGILRIFGIERICNDTYDQRKDACGNQCQKIALGISLITVNPLGSSPET